MKNFITACRYAVALLILSILCIFSSVRAQMIVEDGWEIHDSIHCGTFGMYGMGMYAPGEYGFSDTGQVKKQMDSLGVNWGNEWDHVPPKVDYGNHVYGGTARGIDGVFPDLTQLCKYKCLEWFALPFRIPDRFYPGLFWQYHAKNVHDTGDVHNNTYDENDISPYTEFAKVPAFVTDTFTTSLHGSPSLVHYGDEGRVILGMSDNRDPRRMLKYQINAFFAPVPGTTRYKRDTAQQSHPDTAKTFSVTLVFNADTKTANIDTTLANHRPTDSLPLIRLQVLYKDSTQPTFPLTPFKTATQPSNAGWWKIIDTTITKAIYDKLDDDWHYADEMESGTAAHSWKFKQLHIILTDIPAHLRKYLDESRKLYTPSLQDSGYLEFGTENDHNPDETPAAITTFSNPDNLIENNTPPLQARHLIETRVLSTYRTTVRVRSLTYQDTITDKFLYRKIDPLTGKSHSCEPNGKFGGFDSVVAATASDWSDSVDNKRYGVHWQDTRWETHRYAYPMIAYVDYIGTPYKLYSHWHEQDDGGHSLYFRRDRLSFDDVPPSMFENEGQMFTGPNLCPGDYVGLRTRGITGSWPSAKDTSINGLVFTRRNGATDFTSYKAYDSIYNGHWYYSHFIRKSVHVAHDHPANKRSAIEANMQTWGAFTDSVVWDATNSKWDFFSHKSHWDIKMAFPEEIVGTTLAFLADGITAFNNPQIFYPGYIDGGIPGALAVQHWTFVPPDTTHGQLVTWVHDYNYGKIRGPWFANSAGHYLWTNTGSLHNNDNTTPLGNMYLGFSNTFLATKRVMERINQIYGSKNGNKYPLTRMTWLDAYSNNLASNDTLNKFFTVDDSISKAKAYLKVSKTQMVKLQSRDTKRGFIDSTAIDSAWRTMAEVGLFKDSISPSVVNYAALVVNTRLYPSLQDADDAGYYNAPFNSADSSRSIGIYGDIDTRKVFFKIDTSKFPASFRSNYYVVRDTWHPDTTWLVKSDSEFAVYLKPGEGKFLYFEKGISIQAAKGAGSTPAEFAFNNGRRVAERMKGTRDVITYTRGGKLYVSTPLRGKFVPGLNQTSDEDNISTGVETMISDSISGACHRPSICVARNDTAVAIAFWKWPSQLWVAYQTRPDSGWHTVMSNDTLSLFDTTADFSGVTPVCAPLNDSVWVVAASYQGDLTAFPKKAAGIVTRRFKLAKKTGGYDLVFINNPSTPTYLTSDTGRAFFPTLTSRPIADSLFPMRLAWQQSGDIHYERFKWNATNTANGPVINGATVISRGLPTLCTNRHPSIATIGFDNQSRGTLARLDTVILPPVDPVVLIDYVAWEAVLIDSPKITTHGQWWPVMRTSQQPVNKANPMVWQRSFQIFKPDTTSDGFRFPVVSSENTALTTFIAPITGVISTHPIKIGKPQKITNFGYKNAVQLAWQNYSSERLELAMNYSAAWYKGGLLERGLIPSLAQTTDSISHYGFAPRSIVFINDSFNTDLTHSNHVRVTNGWSPWIDTTTLMGTTLRFVIFDSTHQCPLPHSIVGSLDNNSLIAPIGGGPSTGIYWLPVDFTDGSVLPEGWPVGMPKSPSDMSSTNFPLNYDDQITLSRQMEIDDTAQLRLLLNSATDTVSIAYTLRRSVDSTVIATIEKSIITKDTIIGPGYGLVNPTVVYYHYTGSTDTGFISIDLAHTEGDLLDRTAIVLNDGDNLPLSSYKKAAPPKVTATPKELSVAVIPNPFHSSTQITIEPVENLPLTVALYDELGRKVSELFNGIGDHERYEFTLTNSQLSAGLYYLRIQNGTTIATKKVEVLK